MISLRVPGRICFYGDHQDYLDMPVIAGAINRYLFLEAKPHQDKSFMLELEDLQEERRIGLPVEDSEIEKGDFYLSAIRILEQNGFEFNQGYSVRIRSDIPMNAGLSSSSALVVAWVRFLVATQKNRVVSDAQIGHWAYQAEVPFFGFPGGLMDQYTIAQQGLLFIDTKAQTTNALPARFEAFVVAESGLPKQTNTILKNARNYQERAIAQVREVHPEFDLSHSVPEDAEGYLPLVDEEYKKHWIAAVKNYHITLAAQEQLEKEFPDHHQLGELMNAHQDLLENNIKNTPEAMRVMMAAARNTGAYGAKIVGSGGGGSMVAMVPAKQKEEVVKAFLKAGAQAAYVVELSYPEV